MAASRDRTPFGERLYTARTDKKLSQAALAKLVGMSQSALAELERTGEKSFKSEAIAKATEVRYAWLAHGEEPKADPEPAQAPPTAEGTTAHIASDQSLTYAGKFPASKHAVKRPYVPVVGTAKLGKDGYFEEISTVTGAGDGHVEIETGDPNQYCLRAKGMSMHPAIRDGWYILVTPNSTPAPGHYIVIKLKDGQKMIKEFLYRGNGSLHVLSVNGDERLAIDNELIHDIQAVGGVLQPSMYKPD